jgi:hypothetical protein
MFFMGANMFFGCEASFATEDAVRNQLARKDCVRGKFKDFYLQGQGGSRPPATPAGFSSSVRIIQTSFKNGGPIAGAYLQALLDYGLEGNVEANFYIEVDLQPWIIFHGRQ